MAHFAKRARMAQSKLTLELVSPTRVRMSGAIKDSMIAALGDDVDFDVTSEGVVFARRHYRAVNQAAQACDGVVVSSVPVVVLNASKATPPPLPTDVRERLSKRMRGATLPFQIEGIQKAVSLNGRVLFADEMGLGKTMQALGTIVYMKPKKTLVVCPTSLGQHWCNEIEKWTRLTPLWLNSGKQKWEYDDADVVIVSYGLIGLSARAKHQEIASKKWDCVVVDESHALQDRNSQRTKCMLPILQRSTMRIFITATPQLNSPAQLYVPLTLLFDGFPTWTEYSTRYCDGHIDDRFGCWDTKGATCTSELAAFLATRSLRRYVKDVLKDLPPKRRITRRVTLPPLALTDYQDVKAQFAAALLKLEEVCGKPASKATQKEARRINFDVQQLKMACNRATARVKAPHIGVSIAETVKKTWNEQKRNTVVFAHHSVMINALCDALGTAGIECVRITGATDPKLRQGIVDRAANVGDTPVCAVLSMKACGVGLNFTPGVSHEIFAELDWTPSIMLQAEARAHRMGANSKEIVCEYYLADGTDDDSMMQRLERKYQVNAACVDGGSDGKGFNMSGVVKEAYRGFQLAPYGVQLGASDVHPSAYPIKGESVDAFIKRCTVEIDVAGAELFDPVDKRTFALNALNADAKSEWINQREWTDEALPETAAASTTAHVLVSAPLEEIQKMQASLNAWAKTERLNDWTTCAVFVRR